MLQSLSVVKGSKGGEEKVGRQTTKARAAQPRGLLAVRKMGNVKISGFPERLGLSIVAFSVYEKGKTLRPKGA